MNTKHNWERLYQAAILETDWSKLESHIRAAESGIKIRLHEFSMNHGGTPEENRAIEDALRGLRFLRKDLTAWQSKEIDRIKSS